MDPWHFAVLLIFTASVCVDAVAFASGDSEPERSCGPEGCISVRVLQRHGHPPLSGPGGGDQAPLEDSKAEVSEADLLRTYDEVTVEVWSEVPVATVVLRLPERQQCKSVGDGSTCTGYTFRASADKGCYLRRARTPALPDNPQVNATDIVGGGKLARCTVDNTRGDGTSPTPKRSTAVLMIPPSSGEDGPARQPGWQFFTILVRNPPTTPQGRDVLGNLANAFQVVLKNGHSTVLGSVAYAAVEIRNEWVCGHTDWVRSSVCTARCGGGLRYLTRKLLHPPPAYFEPSLLVNCNLALSKTEVCNDHPCDVDCELGDWTPWADGPCSKSCGGGMEVQRRPIAVGRAGNGRVCAHWTDSARVRYKVCNPQPCPTRCELGSADFPGPSPSAGSEAGGVATAPVAAPLMVPGVCSEPCGGGKRLLLEPSLRKDLGYPAARCANRSEEACNEAPCPALAFYPGQVHDLPVLGRWHDLAVVFRLEDLATSMILQAPSGFTLGREEGGHACLLMEHNLPRLRGCSVTTGERDTAVFDFMNPLEPNIPGRRCVQKYQIRLWVKHPRRCPAGDQQHQDRLCPEVSSGAGAWTLTISSSHEPFLRESLSGGYQLHMSTETHQRSRAGAKSHSHEGVMGLATSPNGHFQKYRYKP